MSLEQQVANLVQASNNLTTAVNNKIGEIDNKVDEYIARFEAAFPEEFARYTKRTIYIDPENGVDTPNNTVYKTMAYALSDNSFVQALTVVLRGNTEFNSSYLVTNRYLNIYLAGHTLTRTNHNAMFNGEFNAFVKVSAGLLNFDLLQPELVNPGGGIAPFFYTVDTVMTLLLGDRDGWNPDGTYRGGLTVQSNASHLVSAVGSHIDYRAHACRFKLIGDVTSSNVIFASSGGSIDQYQPTNVVADDGFTWDYRVPAA